MKSTLNAPNFSHCRAARAGSFGPWSKVALHSVVAPFAELCVRESQTALRISVLRCQTAADFFTKTSPKRFATREK